MKKTSSIILIITFFWTLNCKAQIPGSNIPNFSSPNVASIIKADKISVSSFTGTPNIGIPLYSNEVNGFDISVSLSYNAKGVEPNTHAGWVGTGWTLNAEPVINRKINGLPDETISPQTNNIYPDGKIGWYYPAPRAVVNTSDWATPTKLLNYLGDGNYDGTGQAGHNGSVVADPAPDEFDFHINGFSGAFFMGEDGTWKVRSSAGRTVTIVETPGTVTYNSFTSTSVSTTINVKTLKQFTITLDDGTQYIFGGDNNSIDFNRMGRSDNSDGNPNIIATAWHLTQIILPNKKVITYSYFRQGIQLIYAPSSVGSHYEYSAGTRPSWYKFWDRTSLSSSSSKTTPHIINLTIIDPVYLQSITFPEGKLIFNSSASNEADKRDGPYAAINCFSAATSFAGAPQAYAIIRSYSDLVGVVREPNNANWRKLDDIELDDLYGNKLKDIKLQYSQDASTRQFLNSVQEFFYYKNSTGASLPPYIFTYNQTALPPYCTENVDHWGFYNGPAAFPDPGLTSTFPNSTFQTQYTSFREPNFTYTQAGILQSIKYPTGGLTTFEYEPNKYHTWVGQFPPTVSPLPTNQELTGGGLRVRKITQTDNTTGAALSYEYSYVNDLSNPVSSGVLGMPRPTYFEINSQLSYQDNSSTPSYTNINYSLWTSNPIYPTQNDDGNIVTYSTVFERQSNNGNYNGSRKLVFSNHDNSNGADPNGYLNNVPDGFICVAPTDRELYHYSDRAFERGLLLSETSYDNANHPIKQVQHTYNTDQNRFNSFVRGVYSTSRIETQTFQTTNSGPIVAEENFLRNSAVRFYTFYPFLQQTIETDYSSDQSTPPTSMTTNYAYDAINGTKNMVQETVFNSKNEKLISNFTYPLDFGITATDNFTQGIQKLRGLYAFGIPVEQYTQRGNADGTNLSVVNAKINSFDNIFPFPDLTYQANLPSGKPNFVKATNASGLSKDASYEPNTYIDQYDSYNGSILQTHKDKGPNTSYIWGYKKEYPIAKVQFAARNQIAFSNCEEEGDGDGDPQNNNTNLYLTNYSAHFVTTDSRTGNRSYNLVSNNDIETLSPLPAGNYIVSYWSKGNGRIAYDDSHPVTDQIDLPPDVNGWQYHQGTLNLTTSVIYKLFPDEGGNSILVDDIRIYPVGAQMTTYTYDPLVGMTSTTDPKGEKTTYEYDIFLRLMNAKDKDGSITKHMDYHYQGQN